MEAIAGRIPWKNSRILWQDLLRSQGQESEPVSVEHCSVEYSRSRAAQEKVQSHAFLTPVHYQSAGYLYHKNYVKFTPCSILSSDSAVVLSATEDPLPVSPVETVSMEEEGVDCCNCFCCCSFSLMAVWLNLWVCREPSHWNILHRRSKGGGS